MKTIRVSVEQFDSMARAACELVHAHNENLKAVTLLNNGCQEEARDVLKRSLEKTQAHAHAISAIALEAAS